MASPFSASTADAVAIDATPGPHPARAVSDVLLIAGSGDPVLADFVAFASSKVGKQLAVPAPADVSGQVASAVEVWPVENESPAAFSSRLQGRRIASVVLFLGRGQHRRDKAVVDAVVELARTARLGTVCIVGSFLVHLGDRRAAQAEADVLARLRPLADRIVVFRIAHVLSANSALTARLRRWSFLHPLLPSRFCNGIIEGDELFTAIEQELRNDGSERLAIYALLGTNHSWQTLLRKQERGGWQRLGAGLARGLSCLGLGAILGFLVNSAARVVPQLRRWNCGTLYPTSTRELLELYNKYSYRWVKIVGYNNGVVHFGHSYPGKTVVSTVRCNHKARVRGDVGVFDAGVTLRQAIDVVGLAGKEFHVLPNYSYVSVGTAFFVPIHGSASAYSTLGDTIDRVLLYDPAEDRFVSARRDDPAFGRYIYNLQRDCLVLRLRFRLKEKALYYRKHTRLVNPTSQEILSLLQDSQVANVEIRKGQASGDAVDVYQYYTEQAGDAAALPIPRDALGQLWDKLEANPVTSFLFHALTRWFAFHVEAFFSPEEFAHFWETHRTLPIAKIQLRYIKRDGLPHSPFCRHDCVSADLFMLRKHRPAFEAYIKENFRDVQFNPGKHSA
ncbi:hypothetical protein AYO44_03395 [Planctomycetaceae bacterium SCGC AG-212-F19]|nr:hypothetical protein AYO44_03395 [Planctomycetaceae bacterium SCGC AG-212-F19]